MVRAIKKCKEELGAYQIMIDSLLEAENHIEQFCGSSISPRHIDMLEKLIKELSLEINSLKCKINLIQMVNNTEFRG